LVALDCHRKEDTIGEQIGKGPEEQDANDDYTAQLAAILGRDPSVVAGFREHLMSEVGMSLEEVEHAMLGNPEILNTDIDSWLQQLTGDTDTLDNYG
jgi:hypothetical protein